MNSNFFKILMVTLSMFATTQVMAKSKTCFTFDIRPYKAKLTHSQNIDSITLYHSGFQVPGSKTTTYFMDYGFAKDSNMHAYVDCQQTNNSYIKCANAEEAASLGLFLSGKNDVNLHLEFITLSDYDEPLKLLQPKTTKNILTIPGKAFACPQSTPEDDL